MDVKKQKLMVFLNSVLNHNVFGLQIKLICKSLRLDMQDIINEFFHYNLDVQSLEGNNVYKSLPNRFVLHIHNLIKDSWHIDRQKITKELIQRVSPDNMADIGFGVPSQYVYDLVIKENKFNVTFIDKYCSAFKFAKGLLDQWGDDWKTRIFFLKKDMDSNEYVGDYDLYLFQDAIEHTIDPTNYLKKHVEYSPKDSKFIISLPIGPLFPRHYMEWKTDEEGKKWLEECGLDVESETKIFVNPKVDLFADQIDPNYHDLYVLCNKQSN